MNLRDRLRLLKAAGAARVEEERAAARPAALEPSETPAVPDGTGPRPVMLGGMLDGYLAANPSGEAFYIETRYPVEYRRGPLPLEHLFGLPGSAWEQLGRVPASVDMRRAVFFDTETTGLAGGTGTYAFLIGLGFFEGHDFVVRQYFLRDYHEEEPMLEAIAADLSRFGLLVSFNGKSFDWPLLETRYRMARRRVPQGGAPHLDLLHPARRLWKERLGACNLQNLEAQILGVHRQGDVPGHLIPPLYFDYLRTGNVEPLADVILHNRLDIVSLVSLAGWLGQMVTDPLGATPDGELLCGDDLYALGRLYESRGMLVESLTCYETARERGVAVVGESTLLRQLSTAYKRVREHDQAVAVWQKMIEAGSGLSLFPYVELAKYHEHVTRSYDLAEEMARRALLIAEQRRSLSGAYGPGTLRDLQAVQHRLQRIQRKRGVSE
ncbi:MAG: ribonuclease H-like domain-containing protein [Bacillota bacterium]